MIYVRTRRLVALRRALTEAVREGHADRAYRLVRQLTNELRFYYGLNLPEALCRG